MGPRALMELNDTIYDGLEMILKVIKMLLMSKITFYSDSDDNR